MVTGHDYAVYKAYVMRKKNRNSFGWGGGGWTMVAEQQQKKKKRENSPRENVLGVIIPQIHLGGSPVWNPSGLKVHHFHVLGLYTHHQFQTARREKRKRFDSDGRR